MLVGMRDSTCISTGRLRRVASRVVGNVREPVTSEGMWLCEAGPVGVISCETAEDGERRGVGEMDVVGESAFRCRKHR